MVALLAETANRVTAIVRARRVARPPHVAPVERGPELLAPREPRVRVRLDPFVPATNPATIVAPRALGMTAAVPQAAVPLDGTTVRAAPDAVGPGVTHVPTPVWIVPGATVMIVPPVDRR